MFFTFLGLKKLLNENEAVKMEGGIFMKTADWKMCSPGRKVEKNLVMNKYI